MVKCLEHHRITFSFLIRALLVFFLLLACPCPHHNLLKCHEQFAVVIQQPTLQLMHKRRDQIKTKSLYWHNTMNARVQVVKVFCANSAAWQYGWQILKYMQPIYMYTYGLNTCREQYMVNINNWKLISFNSTWLHKKNLSLFLNLHLSLSLLPLLVCIYLNNAWDLVLLELPLYVCLFKINRFMYSQL